MLQAQNDLADVLEVKIGSGPTAISMLYNESKNQKSEIERLREALSIYQKADLEHGQCMGSILTIDEQTKVSSLYQQK
jgi:hypothetical protein